MRHRRRCPIALFSVLAALLIGFAVLLCFQRNNLRAFIMSMRYSEDELAALQKQSALDLLKEYGFDTDPSSPPLGDGSASEDNLPDSITEQKPTIEDADLTPGTEDTSDAVPGKPSKLEDSSGGKLPQTDALPKDVPQSQTNALPKDVQKLVYSLYSLQSQYIGKLQGIAASTQAQFDALPREQKNGGKRASMIKAGLSQAFSLEDQCDARVASIIRELRAALKKNGLDGTIANNAEDYYATQKGLVKAEYMRKYNKYLK